MADDERPANPYVGPRPFEPQERDEDRFFGRGQETQQLVARIAGHQVVLVYAQSGAGKTSLYNAGVRKELVRSGYQVLPATRVVGAHDDGNRYLLNALAGLGLDGPDGDLPGALDALPPLHDRLGRRQKRVVVFDQFEELFADPSEEAHGQRAAFFAQVDEALARDGLLRLVFMMREDRVAQLDPYADSVRHHFKVRYRLERLDVDSAREAIEEPAARYGRYFDEAAVDYLIDELSALRSAQGDVRGHGLYVEPVSLQVVCFGMWPRLDGPAEAITRRDVEEHGDVTAHLGTYYDEAVAQVADTVAGIDEGSLRAWIDEELITREYLTRGTVERGTEETGGEHPVPTAAVDALVDLHVLRVEQRAGADWYELTHDRFIEPILARNDAWRAERWAAAGKPYEAEARAWVRLNHDPKALLEGKRLAEAQKEIARLPRSLVLDVVEDFIAASAAHEVEEERLRNQRIRRSRIRWIAASVVLAVVSAVALVGWWLAGRRADIAESRALAATAQASVSAGDRLDRPLLLAVAAARIQPEDEARASLLAALTAGSRLRTIRVEPDAAMTALGAVDGVVAVAGVAEGDEGLASFVSLMGEGVDVRVPFGETRVATLALAPSGERLAVPSDDLGSLAVIGVADDTRFDLPAADPASGAPLGGHTGRVVAVAFDPSNGSRLATAAEDGTLIMWNLDERVPRYRLSLPAVDLAFDSAGDRLAVAGADGQVRLLDAGTGAEVGAAAFGEVQAVAFGPAGAVAAGGRDGRVVVWQVTDSGLAGAGELRAGGWAVADLAFYDSGAALALAAGDGTVELLPLGGDPPESLRGHFVDSLPATPGLATEVQVRQAVPVVAVSAAPEGGPLHSASADGSVIEWSPTGPPGFGTSPGMAPACPAGEPFDLAWRAGALQGTCAGGFRVEDGALEVIDGIPAGSASGWAPDGRSVAVAVAGRIEVVAASGEPQREVPGAGDPGHVALANGGSVAWTTADGRLFRSRPGRDAPDVIQVSGSGFTSLAISPDGEWVVAGDAAGRVSRWRADTTAVETVELAPCDPADAACAVEDVTFLADGACVLAAGPVGVVVVVPLEGCGAGVDLFGHANLVSAVAISSDGELLASGDVGGGLILWDARTLLEMARLAGPRDAIATLAFGEGNVLAAGMADGSMLQWRLAIDDLVELACEKLAGTELTESEANRYGVPPQPCP